MISILSRTPDKPKGWRCLGELVGQLEVVGVGLASDPGTVSGLGDTEYLLDKPAEVRLIPPRHPQPKISRLASHEGQVHAHSHDA